MEDVQEPPAEKPRTTAQRAVRLALTHWRLIVATTAILIVPLELWGAYLQRDLLGVDMFAQPVTDSAQVPGGGLFLVTVLLQAVVVAPVAIAVAFLVLTGVERERDKLLSSAFARWWKVVRTTLAQMVVPFFLLLPGLLLMFSGAGDSPDAELRNPAMVFIGLVVFIVAMIIAGFVAIRLFLAVPIAIAEPHGAVDSLKQSWERMPGFRWQAIRGSLGVIVRLGIPAFVLMVAVAFAADALGPAAWSLSGFGSAAARLAFTVIGAAVPAVLYADTLPQPAELADPVSDELS